MVHPSVARAAALGAAHEADLDARTRRRGVHYTPPDVAASLVHLALEHWRSSACPRIVDPACGAGTVLVAAAQALVDRGVPPAEAATAVAGADLDADAVALARRSLLEWSRTQGLRDPPAPSVVVADGLAPDTLRGRWDVVVGNPPFQGQLSRTTARDEGARHLARRRFGPAGAGYVDTAALFLAHAVDRVRSGGVVALIQPRSVLAARHATAVRHRVVDRAPPATLWAPGERLFDAEVDVVVPVLVAGRAARRGVAVRVGRRPGRAVARVARGWLADGSWAALLAAAEGVPEPPGIEGRSTVGDVARATAGFRDEYYGLVPHSHDGRVPPGVRPGRLVTVGAVDPAWVGWGERPLRFAGRRWERPWVDLEAAAASSPRMARWLTGVRTPKVLVATQTRIVEAAADPDGDLVPVTPLVAVVPHATEVWALTAALLSPPVAALAHWRLAGSGMAPGTLRLGADSVAGLPLPSRPDAWEDATTRLRVGPRDDREWERLARRLCEAHGVDPAPYLDWWLDRCRRPARRVDGTSAEVVT